MRLYLLSILCLMAALLMLQPKQNQCCQSTRKSQPPSNTILQLPNFSTETDIANNTNKNTQDGYVFSLPVVPSEFASALPEQAITTNTEQTNLPTTTVNDSNSIISVTDDLTILNLQTQISENQNPNINRGQTWFHLFKLPISSLIILLLTLVLAAFILSASGYGFSLISIPILLWQGFGLAEASIFTALIALVLTSVLVFREQDNIEWEEVWQSIFLQIGALVLGIFILTVLNLLGYTFVSFIVSLVLVILALVRLSVIKLVFFPSWLVTSFDSFFRGMVGFSMPALKNNDWSTEKTKINITAAIWISLPIQIILLIGAFGQPLISMAFQALFFVPIVLLALWIGLWSYKQSKLQSKIVYINYLIVGLMLVCAVILLFTACLKLMQ